MTGLRLRLIHWVASKLPHRLITGEDGTPYLSRYRVYGWMPGSARKWPCSVYLHHFHRPDLDQESPHNHPWKWAVSVILSGQYDEYRMWRVMPKRRFGPGSVLLLRADDFHVIRELHGEVWSLFITGPKAQTWGFDVPGQGFVQWRERLAQRGIEPDYPAELVELEREAGQ